MDDRAAGWPEDSWIKPEHSQSEVRHLVDDDNLVNSHNALRSANPLGRIVAAILQPLHAPLTHDPSHRRIDAAIAAAADAITTSIDGLVEPADALGEFNRLPQEWPSFIKSTQLLHTDIIDHYPVQLSRRRNFSISGLGKPRS